MTKTPNPRVDAALKARAARQTVDGFLRSPVEEARLNEACRLAFGTPPGKAVLTWLRSISVEAVIGPDQGDAALRHQEGMRAIVKLIELRIASAP